MSSNDTGHRLVESELHDGRFLEEITHLFTDLIFSGRNDCPPIEILDATGRVYQVGGTAVA